MCCCDNQPTLFNCRTVTARKDHRCGECLSVIAVGERHEYVSGFWDGEFDQYRTCESCCKLRDSLDGCWCYEHLVDELYCDAKDNPEFAAFIAKRDENWREMKRALSPTRQETSDEHTKNTRRNASERAAITGH